MIGGPLRLLQEIIPRKDVLCQVAGRIGSVGIWKHRNLLEYSTPLLLMQLSIISITSLLIDIFLKPMGQSTIVSQILGGIIFGPSLLGHKHVIGSKLFPAMGKVTLETSSCFGLMFFLFAIGVKMDAGMMVRPGRQAIFIGVAVMFVTLALTAPLSILLIMYVPMDPSLAKSLPLIAASQCLTPFPNIACLLTELKILNTDLGRLALSSSMFCDVLGISLTAIGFAFMQASKEHPLNPLWSICSSVGLVVAIVYLIRPAILYILRCKPEGKPVGETFISWIMIIVLVIGFLSETIGQHYVFGPLVLGLVVPEGPPLGAALVSKLDYPISRVLYPAFLTASGLKTNIFKIDLQSFWIVGTIILFSSLVKIAAVMLPARYSNMPFQEVLVLGLMMNARGICELALYNLWLDAKILTDQGFALVVLSVMGTTAIVTPLIKYLYDPDKQHIAVKRRTIQHAKRGTELRILVCIENPDTVPSIVNLLEASNATEDNPIAVIALLLAELVGRSTPMLIAHQAQRTLEPSTSRSGQIINALRHYEVYNETCVTVQSFSAISHFQSMHEDVCRVALDQNATIVIMPFHKTWAIDGSIGSSHRAMQNVNLKVLEKAPCSVGILIDRGILSGSLSILNNQSVYNVAVIYIGGADDIESLSYSARMARHEHVTLTIIRFLLFRYDNARERKLDSDFINEIRQANAGSERFAYREEVVRDGVELAATFGGLEDSFDLIVVGMHHQESPLMLGLDAWSECPELGVIGDMLASPDFGITASVLVVQQQQNVGGKLASRAMKPVVNDQDTLILNDVVSRRGTAAAPSASDSNRTWAISINRNDTD